MSYSYLSTSGGDWMDLGRTGSVLQPSTTAAAVIIPPAAPLPDPSLVGQTWGWVIPITAGKRTIPGRPVWRRINRNDTTFTMDVAISFGWRAEIIAGHEPVEVNMTRFLANGVVLFNGATNKTAPGVTLTFYDGTQTTADPFLVSVEGAGNVPAYLHHMIVVARGIPLLQFGNVAPDAWALDINDVIEQSAVVVFENSAGIVGFEGSGSYNTATYGQVLDWARDKLWMMSWTESGFTVKEWSISQADSVATHPMIAWGAFTPGRGPPYRVDILLMPVSGHLIVGGDHNVVTSRMLWTVDPVNDEITDEFGPGNIELGRGVNVSAATPPGGGLRDVILASNSSRLCYLLDYVGGVLTNRGSIQLPSPSGSGTYQTVFGGAADGAVATFFVCEYTPFVGTAIIRKVTATYTDETTVVLDYVEEFAVLDANYGLWNDHIITTPDGGVVLVGCDSNTQPDFLIRNTYYTKLDADGVVEWSINIEDSEEDYAFPHPGVTAGYGAGNTSNITTDHFLAYTGAHVYSIALADGEITTYDLDPVMDYAAHFAYNAATNQLIRTDWYLSANDIFKYDLGGEAFEIDGIKLSRAYTLIGDLSRELKGRVTVAPNIDDTINALFITEQGSFNQFALSIGRLCDCDMRESNRGIEIIRAEDGSVVTAISENELIRGRGESGLMFTRAGDDNLPSEIRAQFIANEASFKYTERPARRAFGPMFTTTATRADSVRVPLGMTINQGQTYVSGCLYRETEGRDQVQYALPWSYAVKVQPGDIHTVPDGERVLTVKVIRADRQPNGTVRIIARRLYTTLDYIGEAYAGESLPPFIAQPVLKIENAGGIAYKAAVYPPTIANAE